MNDGALVADLGAITSGDKAVILLDGEDRFWLTETTLGGGGFVEEFLAAYADDPRRYFRFLDASLGGSDLESVSDDLGRILSMVSSGSDEHRDLIDAFEAIRNSASHEESVRAVAQLRTRLSQRGVLPATTLTRRAKHQSPQSSALRAKRIVSWRRFCGIGLAPSSASESISTLACSHW
jgi:hypothetical protein